MTEYRAATSGRDRIICGLILGVFFILSIVWFGRYLSYSAVVSVDLPGHVAVIERLTQQLQHGRLFFYDPWWFGGWSVYQFYGFVAHLLTALIVPLTSIFSREPAQLAVHIFLLLGCALLPASVYVAARALQRGEKLGGESYPIAPMTALCACTLSFWFLNQPLDHFGIGAGSLWHVGLYTQVFAWHLSLLFLVGLFTLSKTVSLPPMCATACVLALLICTSIFAAVFCGFLLLLSIVRFSQLRMVLLAVGLLALGLSAFWWVPMISTIGAATISHSEPPQGDLLGLLVRQPVALFISQILRLLSGEFNPVEVTPLFGCLIALASFASPRFWQSERGVTNALLLVVSLVLFSSHYIADSLPLGLHYYRFNSFILLYLIVLLVSNGAHLYHVCEDLINRLKLARIFRSTIVIVCLVCLSMTWAIAVLRERAVAKSAEKISFKSQHQVLSSVKSVQNLGRVAFEYFRDRDIFPFLSPHFMESKLARFTARETVQGLFIQSSLSAQFAAESMKSLGFDAYRIPPIWGEQGSLPRDLAIEQLRDFRVTTIVSAHREPAQRLASETGVQIAEIADYQLVPLLRTQTGPSEPIRKQLVGYLDRRGGVPFKYIQSVFYLTPELYRNTHLIEVHAGEAGLPQEMLVLVHGESRGDREIGFELPARARTLSAFDSSYDQKFFSALSGTLSPVLSKVAVAERSSKSALVSESNKQESFDFLSQQLVLRGLEPGTLYTVPYSFSPYFVATGGAYFRSIRDAMVVLPQKSEVVLHFDRFKNTHCLYSAAVSSISFLLIVVTGVIARLRRREL